MGPFFDSDFTILIFRLFPLNTDSCFRLLAADCSIHRRFAVMSVDLEPSKPIGPKEITIMIGKSMINILSVPDSHLDATSIDNLDGISIVQSEQAITISAPLFGLQEIYLDITQTMSIQLNPLVLKGMSILVVRFKEINSIWN